MSGSPAEGSLDDQNLLNELGEGAQLAGNEDTGGAPPQAKRGRGRPKGSKNKKSAADTAASTSEVAPAAGEKRKRGRPPKPKNVPEESATTGEPAPKRKRGRPPKPKPISSPPEDVGEGGTTDFPAKRKRGRPPKNAA